MYLTVFAAKYLPVHVIKAIDASDVYSSNIGAHDGLLKVRKFHAFIFMHDLLQIVRYRSVTKRGSSNSHR